MHLVGELYPRPFVGIFSKFLIPREYLILLVCMLTLFNSSFYRFVGFKFFLSETLLFVLLHRRQFWFDLS